MVKKHQIGLFLDIQNDINNQNFVRIKKSTELTISLNPQTEEYDYIADESPTTELLRYQPSIDQPLTMYEGEDDFKMVYDAYYNLRVGGEAHARVMIVYIFDGNSTKGYKSWESDCILQVTEMNGVDSTITMTINFGGTVRRGIATMTDGKPTFTEGVPSDWDSDTASGDDSSGGNTGFDSNDDDDDTTP